MSKLKFTPIDFAGSTGNNFHVSWDDAAAIANARLAEMLKGAKVVYGAPTKDGKWSAVKRDEKEHIAISSNFINDTHCALLINIEEIKRECVEHEPEDYNCEICQHCKKRIKAVKWECAE